MYACNCVLNTIFWKYLHVPLKRAQYTIPTPILDLLITTFNINHSYFSSPVTCPTQFTQFYSSFSRDIIFGSLGKTFDHKWQGIGYAHPHNATNLQQAIHWARMAAQNDPYTITILISPGYRLVQKPQPAYRPFPGHTCYCSLCRWYDCIWRTQNTSRTQYYKKITIYPTNILYPPPKQ